jgi:hypothetical protein
VSQYNKSLSGINKAARKYPKQSSTNKTSYSQAKKTTNLKTKSSKIKKQLMLNIKNSEVGNNEVKNRHYKELNMTSNLEKLIGSIGSQPKTPSSHINSLPFTSNNKNFMKSPRFLDQKGQTTKKYISPRGNREKSKNYSQPKTKTASTSNPRKRHFDYSKHNESANYYDTKRVTGLSGVNISIQEVEASQNKSNKRSYYGTSNVSHILALLNDKKNSVTNSKSKGHSNDRN